jgi:hypothetical protein
VGIEDENGLVAASIYSGSWKGLALRRLIRRLAIETDDKNTIVNSVTRGQGG